MTKTNEGNEKVTLAILSTKIDMLSQKITDYHDELKVHILKDESEFAPLKSFRERAYAGFILLSFIVGVLGWNQIQRLFTIEVIRP